MEFVGAHVGGEEGSLNSYIRRGDALEQKGPRRAAVP